MKRITIFTKPADPYSVRLKEFLRVKKLPFKEVVVTDDNPDAFAELAQMTGEMECPQLCIGDEHIGDYEKITSLDLQGKFDVLLE